jgi:large subunit ribosomal protein L4
MKIKVLNTQGKETGKEVSLDDAVFGLEPSDHNIYLAVKQYLANQRQGTHKAKERSEVAGSTRKIKRQKGTGGARAGDIKNPLFRGGGRVFGPRVRDYGFKLNKKQKALAKKSALSSMVKDSNLVVVEDFNMEAPKTAELYSILKNLGLGVEKALIVLPENNANIYLSARNIPNAAVTTASRLNVYDVLNCKKIVFAESSVKAVEESFKK